MSVFSLFAAVGDSCNFTNPNVGGGFLGFPTWYKYLPGNMVSAGNSAPDFCAPRISGLSDVWLIVAAAIEILLRIAVLAAIAMVMYGGFQIITSQGEPAGMQKGRQTVVNALIGLVIAIAATTLVSFLAGRFA